MTSFIQPADDQVPQVAIDAFERNFSVLVTVHDRAGNLAWALDERHRFHRHPACQAVKASGGSGRCWRFDSEQVRAEAEGFPAGRIHRCHAGLVEWAMPVFDDGLLWWVLFAGPRTAAPGFTPMAEDRQPEAIQHPYRGEHLPPSLDQATAEPVLEALRQLAARLERWAHRRRDTADYTHDPIHTKIRSWLERHHRDPDLRLGALAAYLGLSENQAGRIVRREFAATFPQVLARTRVASARELLRQTRYDLTEIALAVGFRDPSSLHRQFRRITGTTPSAWRREHAGGQ